MRLYAGLHPPNVHFRTKHRRTGYLDNAVSQSYVGGQMSTNQLKGTPAIKCI